MKEHHPVPETVTRLVVFYVPAPWIKKHPCMIEKQNDDGDKPKPVQVMSSAKF